MLCPKCGAQNPSDVQFCTSCGEQIARPVNGTKDPANKKRLLMMVGAAAAVLLLILVIAFALPGDGAKNAADDLCDAIVEMDANAALKLLPPAVLDYFSDTVNLKEASVKIIDRQSRDADYVKDVDEKYKVCFGTEDGYVQDAATVHIEVDIPDRKLTKDPIPLAMIKVDGKWYLDILTTAEEIDEADWEFRGIDFSSFAKYFK
ncbi:MAG: zinc ribbon domain-containing protein [Oscillospiraceae bacterium]|nr:zinc ribbon domain-containing protein [Oscillospiraceae bacterium]